MKSPVSIIWFKRDLRVHDHSAIFEACRAGVVLPIYVWDRNKADSNDYSLQHQVFIQECLVSLRASLAHLGLTLFEFHTNIIEVLNHLSDTFIISGIYSHEETGNGLSFQVDQSVAAWCNDKQIQWHEYPQNGVVRRLNNRDHWTSIWESRMHAPQAPNITSAKCAVFPKAFIAPVMLPDLVIGDDKPLRQKGGRDEALKILQTFLNGRASRYRGGISSPLTSEHACSRLSPYLTWGVISTREVMQALRAQKILVKQKPDMYPKNLLTGLVAFESRLHWRCHFMQKLESEPAIEYCNLHSKFNGFRDEAYGDSVYENRLSHWKNGTTGWPLVDACMAMLRQMGWINFRMRAMLMSTASYLLWLHWRETGLHLAREFLDYEPGIHWSQVQMQSGTTGINMLRIYNPVKQAMNQDPDGVFVRHWLPALRNVPNTWIFQPWLMPESLQREYGCEIGVDYPAPLVDIGAALKLAKLKFSQLNANRDDAGETLNIIKRHASRKNRDRAPTAAKKVSSKKRSNQTPTGQQTLF